MVGLPSAGPVVADPAFRAPEAVVRHRFEHGSAQVLVDDGGAHVGHLGAFGEPVDVEGVEGVGVRDGRPPATTLMEAPNSLMATEARVVISSCLLLRRRLGCLAATWKPSWSASGTKSVHVGGFFLVMRGLYPPNILLLIEHLVVVPRRPPAPPS